ncbi:hypothetical protein ACRKSW_05100 [Providencia sp. 2024EL-00811]|uniref:hypothetical protein n=1 Tax=Providencia TaxID=586 RepID=UPI001EE7122A|nr:hypothetical protein [Providencia rettgeri]ELR5068053.1 hypothetical protein [Providencia rettgeri]MCG5368699.1 hypothetical protein [Providencia rettgeri]
MKCFKPSKETKKTLERLLIELRKSATGNSNAAIIDLYDAALKDGTPVYATRLPSGFI